MKVSEVFNLQMGKTPSRKNPSYWNNGDHDWVSIKDLGSYGRYVGHTKETISELGRMESGIKPVPAGTLLMSFKLSLGKTAITTKQTYTNEAIMAFLDKGCYQFDLGYMWHQFRSKDWTEGTNIAVMGKTLNKQTLGKAMIRLPELREQENISTLLDKAQEQLAIAETMQVKLDTLVKSRFIEMFGDETEFGKWPVGRIEDIADVTVGVVIKPTQYYVEEGGVKAFRSLNVKPMKINDDDWVHFSEEGNLKNCKSMLHTGDVLIVRSGYPGTSCVVEPEYDGCNAVDLIIAKPNKAIVNPYFLCAFNNYPHGQSQIKQGTGGAAQQHFNVGKYKAMSIPLPPLELQNEFVEFAQQVDKSRFVVRLLVGKYNDAMTAIENFITRQGG